VKRLAFMVATWFGCGFWPWGPGTAGSIAAVVLAWAGHRAFGFAPVWLLLWAALVTPLGVWAATVVEKESGRTDPSIVVVDEVAGQWLTLAGAVTLNWKSWLIGLILFRIFDIWKPYPVRRLERLGAGWGIMGDDLMAGVYGALVLFAAGCFNLY